MLGFFARIFDSFPTEKCSCADCLYSSDCTLDKSIGCGTVTAPLLPESCRVDDEQLAQVQLVVELEEVATFQARIDAAYERANELVSPNSPEYESLLEFLTEKYLEEEGGAS